MILKRGVIIIIIFINLNIHIVKTTSFDDHITNMVYRTRKISYTKCKEICDSHNVCLSMKYYTRYKICEMFKSDRPERYASVFNYIKPGHVRQRLNQSCIDCTPPKECTVASFGIEATCTLQRCPWPELVGGTVMYGNQVAIGSKLKLQCTGTTDFVIIKCRQNTTWSSYNLSCNMSTSNGTCGKPDVEHGTVHFSDIQGGMIRADVVCDPGYSLFKEVYPKCNTTSGRWNGFFKQICCDVYRDGTWNKVFRYEPGTNDGVLGWWKSGTVLHKTVKKGCVYRNTTILADWNGEVALNRVKLNVIKDEQIVAYIIFDARLTRNLDWFTKDRVLDSSWTDLNRASNVEQFSLQGLSKYGSTMRFVIAKRFSGICEQDTGWFVVTQFSYPCGSTKTNILSILYSPLPTATSFTQGQIAYADRFEVWVEEA